MNALIALVRKDLVLHFSNRRAVILGIAAPILIAVFFGGVFGGDARPSAIPIAVADLDHSAVSTGVVAALRADPALKIVEATPAQGLAQVRDGRLRAAITLPAGFGRQAAPALFGAGPRPEITVAYDPSQSMVLPMVRGLLAQHVMAQLGQHLFSAQGPGLADLRQRALASRNLSPAQHAALAGIFDNVERLDAATPAAVASAASASSAASADSAASDASGPAPGRAGGLQLPFDTRELQASAQAGQHYNSYAHAFAGMGVQFILLMGVDMGIGLLLMRRLGLWQRLRAAPLSRAVLLGSRVLSCALIALIVFGVVYAVAIGFFHVRIEGSAAGFVAVLVAFALLTASFGLLIAALGRTPEATRGLAILATLLMVMLGGAWVPSFIFPPWLQTVSMAVPTRWAVDGLDAMTWRGLPLSAAVAPVLAMLGFSAVFSLLALARFDWDE